MIFPECLCLSLSCRCKEFGEPNTKVYDNETVKLKRKKIKHQEATGSVRWEIFLSYNELVSTTLCGHIGRTAKRSLIIVKSKTKTCRIIGIMPGVRWYQRFRQSRLTNTESHGFNVSQSLHVSSSTSASRDASLHNPSKSDWRLEVPSAKRKFTFTLSSKSF